MIKAHFMYCIYLCGSPTLCHACLLLPPPMCAIFYTPPRSQEQVKELIGIKESDTGLSQPSQWDLVSDKQMMQEEQPLQVRRARFIYSIPACQKPAEVFHVSRKGSQVQVRYLSGISQSGRMQRLEDRGVANPYLSKRVSARCVIPPPPHAGLESGPAAGCLCRKQAPPSMDKIIE